MYRIVKMIRTDFFPYNIKFTKCVGKNSMYSKLKHNLLKKSLCLSLLRSGDSVL